MLASETGLSTTTTQLRLVGGGAHEAPGAVLDRDAYAVDGDEVADRLAGDLLAAALRRREMLHHGIDHGIFHLVGAVRRHGGRLPGPGQRLAEVGHALVGIALEHVANRER